MLTALTARTDQKTFIDIVNVKNVSLYTMAEVLLHLLLHYNYIVVKRKSLQNVIILCPCLELTYSSRQNSFAKTYYYLQEIEGWKQNLCIFWTMKCMK